MTASDFPRRYGGPGPADAPAIRSWALALAVGALVAAWAGPLPTLAMTRFTAHMTMHLLVVALAAPLIAYAIAGGRFDPSARWPALFAPMPAALVELVVIWAWHAPALHDAVRIEPGLLALEQGSFLAVGLLLWISALGGAGRRRGERAAAGVGGLLLTSMHMTLLGALLVFAPRPLYEACAGLGDQQLGGIMMLAVGGLVYLVGGLWLLAGLLRKEASS